MFGNLGRKSPNNNILTTENIRLKRNFRFKENERKIEYREPDEDEPKITKEKETDDSAEKTKTETSAKTNNTYEETSKEINFLTDLNKNENILEDWFTVKSDFFLSSNFLTMQSDPNNYKINNGQRLKKFEVSKGDGSKSDEFFWFKLKKGYIYYFETESDVNALDAILIKSVEDSNIPGDANNILPTCIFIFDFQKNKFEICTFTLEMKLKWLCSIQNYLKVSLDDRCITNKDSIIPPIIKKELKHVIIIPTASKSCNEGWNYANKGRDWECTCKEGVIQSPINLPEKKEAVKTNLSPLFSYERVNVNEEECTSDGLIEEGKKITIRHSKNNIRIFHPNMGKIVAIDGSVYVAEEIVFHTPSEHKINGQQFDMEMQVIHYGKTKGDIANQVVLSILFKSSPGHYNKFLDKIDFFNLPNPIDPVIELQHEFFIPSVFLDSDADDILSMEPFSFFNYEGSLTAPPCTERTTYYVTADPIPLSNTIIHFFKEALSKPQSNEKDKKETLINGLNGTNNIDNNRDTQDLNGRTVYLYDHILNGYITYQPPKRNVQKIGHFEKIITNKDEYIYVNRKDPTKIPGSVVVSENEASDKYVKEFPI